MASREGASHHDSWMMKTHKVMKKANNSLIGYMSHKPHWPISPGSVEKILKPQHKNVEKIINMGFDLFKNKKTSNPEQVHQLRLLENHLIQWRFINARAHVANHRLSHMAQSHFICAFNDIAKLRQSVVQRKKEIQRVKLKMKLTSILHSQMKLLKMWRKMRRQHVAAITLMKDCLYSVACRVYLLEGAKVDVQLSSIYQRRAADLTDSMRSMLSSFSPLADKTAELISELAKVVVQERFLLEEFNDIFHTMCVLELQESSLMCNLIQLKC